MKKIIISIAAVLSLASFTSCSDMLEEVNYGNPTIEDVMSKPDNAVLLVGQAYADIKWLHDHWGYWGVASLTSDECLTPMRMPGKHWSDGGYWTRLNTHAWKPDDDAFRSIWNSTISGAVGCNKILSILGEYKDTIDETTYAQYTCELETLRSYYFYMLFDCFGRIPYTESFEVEELKPLTEPVEVWATLVNTLERNAKVLPVVNDGTRAQYYGRVTQGFAYALLARLYLNAESFMTPVDPTLPQTVDFEKLNSFLDKDNQIADENDFYKKCVESCDKIISSGAYSIEKNFFTNFAIHNENSRENIFVIVEDGRKQDAMSMGSMSNKLRIHCLTGHYQMQKTWGLVEKPWNGFCARPTFIDRYNEEDVRGTGNENEGTMNKKQWGWFVGPVCDKEGNVLKDENSVDVIIKNEVKGLSNATWNDGARMMKYEIDKTGTYQYSENDFVLFRYADVLWMREEAIVRNPAAGATQRNSEDFKTMLARSFDYSGTELDACLAAFYRAYPEDELFTLDGICDERGREFAWENLRRRDLIRFGKFGDPDYVEYVAADATDPYRNWFPIPYAILEKAERNPDGSVVWTQNYGYEEFK